jgi:hypothetical protein
MLCAEPTDVGTFYRPDAHRQLRAVKAAVDPDGVFRANHPIEPGSHSSPSSDPFAFQKK